MVLLQYYDNAISNVSINAYLPYMTQVFNSLEWFPWYACNVHFIFLDSIIGTNQVSLALSQLSLSSSLCMQCAYNHEYFTSCYVMLNILLNHSIPANISIYQSVSAVVFIFSVPVLRERVTVLKVTVSLMYICITILQLIY